MGAWLRETGSNVDGWRNGGKTPLFLQVISENLPPVTVVNAFREMLFGKDIHDQSRTLSQRIIAPIQFLPLSRWLRIGEGDRILKPIVKEATKTRTRNE